jgi:transposase-like protein
LAGRKVYTDEEKAEAIKLAIEVGAAEAARQTGISRGTIVSWTSRMGVATVANERTREATKAVKANAEQRREKIRDTLLKRVQTYLDWTVKPTIDYVGTFATKVTRDHPSAPDIRNLVIAASVAIDKAELLSGKSTSNSTLTIRDAIRSDHERDALEAAIRGELARRAAVGEPQQ